MKRSIPANKRSSSEMLINAEDFHVSFYSWACNTIHYERLPVNQEDRKRLKVISNSSYV